MGNLLNAATSTSFPKYGVGGLLGADRGSTDAD